MFEYLVFKIPLREIGIGEMHELHHMVKRIATLVTTR